MFKDKVEWAPLMKLLTVIRVKELSRVKIVRKGGRGKGLRYDIADLAASFYGKKILREIAFGRRRVVDASELATIRAACAKIKLVLPEDTEPTTTERYFQGEL
jgi:hypothetical protein